MHFKGSQRFVKRTVVRTIMYQERKKCEEEVKKLSNFANKLAGRLSKASKSMNHYSKILIGSLRQYRIEFLGLS